MSLTIEHPRLAQILDMLSMCVAELEEGESPLPPRSRRHVLALLLLAMDEIKLVAPEAWRADLG
jgi:hypothetical protein